MRTLLRHTLCGLLLLGLALPAAAEIYRWTDESGRTHFTQDLSKVPARHRPQARSAAAANTRSKVQTFENDASSATLSAPASRAGSDGGDERTYRIRVQRAGTSMMVNVRLNNSITAPFLIDTGASDVVLPKAVAEQLGIDLGPSVRTKRYSTANGVIEQAAITLRSVELGGARVDNVPASVSDSMGVGLLGLSFFNHFTYNIDASAGVVTLTRNDMAATGLIRGGRSEAQWRSEFRQIQARIEYVQWRFDNKADTKARGRKRLLDEKAELQRQFGSLEADADRARVPMSWRQ